MLRITEELLLLIMDAKSGTVHHTFPEHQRDAVMAGAVLMDLALENRIDTDLTKLFLVDSTPVGDDLLDPALCEIAKESQSHDTAYWVIRTAKQGDIIREKAQLRLINLGILEANINGPAFLSPIVERAHRYPAIDGEIVEDVRSRVMAALFSDDIPSTRDTIIIGLAAASGVFESILSREELAEMRKRIDEISRLDLMGHVIQESIRRIKPDAPAVKTVEPYEKIPQVPGLPIAGNAFEMAGDVREFLKKGYHKYGPIFRIRAFGHRFIALVGTEANTFLTKIASTHLRSYESYRDFGYALGGGHRSVLNMDGPEHLRMRKLLIKGFSPKVIESNLSEFTDITRSAIAKWPQGQPLQIQRTMQEIVGVQIGQVCSGFPPNAYIHDIIQYLKMVISIHIMKRWPPVIERLPKYRRLNERMKAFHKEMLESLQSKTRDGETTNYFDNLLEMNHSDPQFLPETDLRGNVLAPFAASVDTSGSACAFMLFALLKHPDILEQMREEVDNLFARGPLTTEGLRELEVTRRIVLETLRMYPVIPVIKRTVSNSFEFAGYQVPAGKEVLIGVTVPHHLPECFPDPDRFDIERYTKGIQQHRKPGAFAPFGLGRHTCLAASLAELQITLTMAIIIRETDLELHQPDLPLKINVSPNPHPHESLKFRLVNRRKY